MRKAQTKLANFYGLPKSWNLLKRYSTYMYKKLKMSSLSLMIYDFFPLEENLQILAAKKAFIGNWF